jgi:hypothetical protein
MDSRFKDSRFKNSKIRESLLKGKRHGEIHLRASVVSGGFSR